MRVAQISIGYSDYHDDLWEWLANHDHILPRWVGYSSADSWDYVETWGILSLAGCSIQYEPEMDVPKAHRIGTGNVNISFDGTITELLGNLGQLI